MQPKTAPEPAPAVDLVAALQGLRVTLSDQAQARGRTASKNADIDSSSLPDSIKQMLRMMRERRAQIAEKQAELQAVRQERHLSEEARQQKVQGLQGELAALERALSTTSFLLVEAMHDTQLSPEQLHEVAQLSLA